MIQTDVDRHVDRHEPHGDVAPVNSMETLNKNSKEENFKRESFKLGLITLPIT